MKEHKLKLNGIHGFVFSVENSGQKIIVSGWNIDHFNWKVGDMFILQQKSGEETRYQADKIERPGNPNDQYFMHMTFKPRISQ